MASVSDQDSSSLSVSMGMLYSPQMIMLTYRHIFHCSSRPARSKANRNLHHWLEYTMHHDSA